MKTFTAISLIILATLWPGDGSITYAEQTNHEDDDLDFLSSFIEETDNSVLNKNEKITQEEHNNFKFSVDNTVQYSDKKNPLDLIFKLPEKGKSGGLNLTRLGLRGEVSPYQNTGFEMDSLLNAYTREGDSFNASDDLRLDIKEAYLYWQQSPTQFVDIGRINIKSGVATGFNPTDYFKVGTVLDRNTEDISQLRDARIGALVLQGQKLWDKGSLTLVASPKISERKDHWTTDKAIFGLNLHKSNDRSRAMLKFNHKIGDDLSPEFIYYHESGRHNFGLNISIAFNDKWIGYAEGNMGERRNIANEALYKHRISGQISPLVASVFPDDEGEKYQQQIAIGASFTSSSNITTSLEYHYNEAGLSAAQAETLFDAAEVAGTNNDYATTGQLLSIRGLAQSRGEPLGQHSLFIRSKLSDAGIDKLDLSGLLITDLNDHSHLIQAEVSYELNPKSLLAFRLAKFQEDDKSHYGSLSNDVTATVQFEYIF